MQRPSSEYITICERLLAESLVGVARDLRQLDAVDLVAWVHGSRYGTVASIIGSSTEMEFRPGTMRFALSGSAKLSWRGLPDVRLDMEFHHDGVDCYFELHIAEAQAGIAIVFLSVDGSSCSTAGCLERFSAALIGARRVDVSCN